MKIKFYLPYITQSKRFQALPPYAQGLFLSLCETIEYKKLSYEDFLNIKTNKIIHVGTFWRSKISLAIETLVSRGFLEYSKGEKVGWHNFRIILVEKRRANV